MILDQREERRMNRIRFRTHPTGADVEVERAAARALYVDPDRRLDRAHRVVDAATGLAERPLLLERSVELRGDPLAVEVLRRGELVQRAALRRW